MFVYYCDGCCFYLQCFIPTASHDTAVVWGLDPVDCFNWAIVLWREIMRTVTGFCFIRVHTVVLGFCSNLCDLDGLVAVEIPHLGCLVTGSCEDFASILDRKKRKADHKLLYNQTASTAKITF